MTIVKESLESFIKQTCPILRYWTAVQLQILPINVPESYVCKKKENESSNSDDVLKGGLEGAMVRMPDGYVRGY